jgi:glycosyltransferase involved in cell wall biosynthesis
MVDRVPRTIVHYSRFNPEERTGGVETFARNLALAFERVLYMTPATRDETLVRHERLPVVCDNHWVRDWPSDIPVIGFQHGFAASKLLMTRRRGDLRVSVAQLRAARRPNTLWVACARWIGERFGRWFGNPAAHVIYHPVDLDRFDGRLGNAGSKLVLHDARSPHKGQALVAELARAFPELAFEPLACAPADVPDRMRRAAAFVHLSRYEGNSIVCNEAMAMNLPCLFTRVGLMLDGAALFDVRVVEPRLAFGGGAPLVEMFRAFLRWSREHTPNPRAFCLEQTNLDENRMAWARAVADLEHRFAWPRR